ncbi:MAG: glutamyl-tRNA reductase [Acidobacteriia bacterium]|nr:glutamyl-tRNA reductase [Terriglobia bacterium]
MPIFLVGLNHTTAPVEVRERVVFNSDQSRTALTTLSERGLLREDVILSTCNRSEIYGLTEGETSPLEEIRNFICEFHQITPATLNGCFYQRAQEEAVRHLFRVASSLDSQVVGEPHILGQVRNAFVLALENKSTGIVLNRLFQKAVEVGKRVRAETEIGSRPVSLSSVAVETAAKIFGKLEGRAVLVLGAGEMSELTVESLSLHGVTNFAVANRSFDRAKELAAKFKGTAIPWENLDEALLPPDIIISSTSSPDFVITKAHLERLMSARKHRPLFFIDIALPRDIDPRVQEIYNVYLYNLDDLKSIAENNRAEREKDIPKADRIVDEEVRLFMRWLEGLAAVPTVTSLRKKVELIRTAELEAHLRKLGPLGERERNIIDALTQSIVNKILHEPTIRLKRTADESERQDHAKALRYLFDLDKEEW